MSKPKRASIVLTPDQAKRLRQRNIAMAVALGLLVILFYVVTFVKGPGVANLGF
jgi:hypothetical protein